jgi:hypothetical protein
MSIKGFHIFFITLASLMSFGFFGWSLFAPPEVAGLALRLTGIVSAVAGVALAIYGVIFYKKSKRIIT